MPWSVDIINCSGLAYGAILNGIQQQGKSDCEKIAQCYFEDVDIIASGRLRRRVDGP